MSSAPAAELPTFIAPQLLKAGTIPEADARYATEVKWDGCRLQARICDGQVRVRTRPGRDATSQFPELVALGAALRGTDAILDGELVCLAEDGAPDFERLRGRLRIAGGPSAQLSAVRWPVKLHIFDLLFLGHEPVWRRPLSERRELLEDLGLDDRRWCTPRQFVGQGAELLEATRARGLEGVVAKRLDAPYVPGQRPASWVKHKHRRHEDLVVVAWRPAEDGKPPEIALARRDEDGGLSYAGNASFGAAVGQVADLLPALELPARRRQRMRSVAPELSVRVAFHGRPDGPLRDASIRAVIAAQ